MKRFAILHPSAELYGSDRVLLDHVKHLDRGRYEPLVVLPRRGPLSVALTRHEVPWQIADVVSVTRAERARPGLLAMRSLRALRRLDRLGAKAGVEFVHTSTSACLGGPLWSRLAGLPHLWHLQEIPTRWGQRLLAPLLAASSGPLVCNSAAVADWVGNCGARVAARTRIVYPGRERPSSVSEVSWGALDVPKGASLALLLGRLTPRKGHRLALAALKRTRGDLHLVIAGGEAPGHPGYARELRAQIARSPCWRRVHLLPRGSHDPWSLLAASDLVLVPSVEPESFGLVALEAMLSGRPVLASAEGGLGELVIPEETGLLLPPEPEAWASAWERLAKAPDLRASWGAAGLARGARFSTAAASEGLARLYEGLCAD
ncbi:MAG: glycosyltransferase family 4 protein [Planctomycetes bacterium]|nr:glycosyltransferase family 4 protein [Planctomycetota bacterium]